MAERGGTTPVAEPEAKPEKSDAPVELTSSEQPKGFFAERKERKAEERQAKRVEGALQGRRSAAARLDNNEKRLDALTSGAESKDPNERENLENDIKEDHRLLAKANLELWKTGQLDRLETNDLVTIEKDLIENGEKSAIAELILNKQGFETFEDALRQLKLTEAEYAGNKVDLGDSGKFESFYKSPAVREQLTKLGISGTASVAVLTAITLLGGPVTWATAGVAAAGIAGGAVGRGFGEFIRSRMLTKKEDKKDDKLDGPEQFNQVVAEDLLQQIVNIQSQAETTRNLGETDPNIRAKSVLELINSAALIETRSAERYETMEKRASKIKIGLSILGAVGGAAAASALVGHVAAQRAAEAAGDKSFSGALAEAKAHGLRIFHDSAGHAHITNDPSVGHVVKNGTDKLWHQLIEQKDITGYNVHGNEFAPAGSGGHITGAAEITKHAGPDGYKGVLDYYASGHPLGVGVPTHLPATELQHIASIDAGSAESAIRENLHHAADLIKHDALITQLLGSIDGVAPIIGMEVGNARGEKAEKEQRKADNEQLIGSLAEIDSLLSEADDRRRRNEIMGVGEQTPQGRIPENPKEMRQLLERIALDNNISHLPEGPRGMVDNWTDYPQKLDSLNMLPLWYKVYSEKDAEGKTMFFQDADGNPLPRVTDAGLLTKIGIASVDPEHNRITIIKSIDNYDRTKSYYFPVVSMRLDQFLYQYRPLKGDEPGSEILPTTASDKASPDKTDIDSNPLEPGSSAKDDRPGSPSAGPRPVGEEKPSLSHRLDKLEAKGNPGEEVLKKEGDEIEKIRLREKAAKVEKISLPADFDKLTQNQIFGRVAKLISDTKDIYHWEAISAEVGSMPPKDGKPGFRFIKYYDKANKKWDRFSIADNTDGAGKYEVSNLSDSGSSHYWPGSIENVAMFVQGLIYSMNQVIEQERPLDHSDEAKTGEVEEGLTPEETEARLAEAFEGKYPVDEEESTPEPVIEPLEPPRPEPIISTDKDGRRKVIVPVRKVGPAIDKDDRRPKDEKKRRKDAEDIDEDLGLIDDEEEVEPKASTTPETPEVTVEAFKVWQKFEEAMSSDQEVTAYKDGKDYTLKPSTRRPGLVDVTDNSPTGLGLRVMDSVKVIREFDRFAFADGEVITPER